MAQAECTGQLQRACYMGQLHGARGRTRQVLGVCGVPGAGMVFVVHMGQERHTYRAHGAPVVCTQAHGPQASAANVGCGMAHIEHTEHL